jgi:hypothetical protein
MVVSQAIVSSVVDITRMSCYAYYLLTANLSKSSYQQTVDTFIFQFSIMLSYLNYSESFYTNTLSSILFRKVFRETCKRNCRGMMQIFNICKKQQHNGVRHGPLAKPTTASKDQYAMHPIGNVISKKIKYGTSTI